MKAFNMWLRSPKLVCWFIEPGYLQWWIKILYFLGDVALGKSHTRDVMTNVQKKYKILSICNGLGLHVCYWCRKDQLLEKVDKCCWLSGCLRSFLYSIHWEQVWDIEFIFQHDLAPLHSKFYKRIIKGEEDASFLTGLQITQMQIQ